MLATNTVTREERIISLTALRALKMFIVAATVAMAGLIYVSPPVMAQETITVFLPPQTIQFPDVPPGPGPGPPSAVAVPPPGNTLVCTGGLPFIQATSPTAPGNCRFVANAVPGDGLVCDIPTTVFVPARESLQIPAFTLQAFQCRLPEPTTKDQCKNGGFATFGIRNQGDCTSFVATEGKNEPGKNQK